MGKTPYTSLEFTDLSRDEEINVCLDFIKEKAGPDADLVGVGLSMGANVMVRAAGLQGKDFPLKAMASVNNPFDIWLTFNLMRGSGYERHLCKLLVAERITRDYDEPDA